MLSTTKGYAAYTNGIYRADVWKAGKHWRIFTQGKGHTTLGFRIKTIDDVKKSLEVRLGGPVELHRVYW